MTKLEPASDSSATVVPADGKHDQSKDASGNIDSTGFPIDCNSEWASNETLTNWYMMSCTTLDNANVNQFFEAGMKHFLGKCWDYNLANDIGSIPEADGKAFVDFAERVLTENCILEGRGSHLTESMLLQRLWNAIMPVLRTDLDCNDDKAVAIGHLCDKILNELAKLSEVVRDMDWDCDPPTPRNLILDRLSIFTRLLGS
ncbi:hypothetical protein V5O48_016778 [Marasmius crinis-equi]|uniref:Uncharacterized protein n=1 Tax=Marasmius crinis-equi TaxID=585013 RepID=A0ABR3EQY8_9AGAR